MRGAREHIYALRLDGLVAALGEKLQIARLGGDVA